MDEELRYIEYNVACFSVLQQARFRLRVLACGYEHPHNAPALRKHAYLAYKLLVILLELRVWRMDFRNGSSRGRTCILREHKVPHLRGVGFFVVVKVVKVIRGG